MGFPQENKQVTTTATKPTCSCLSVPLGVDAMKSSWASRRCRAYSTLPHTCDLPLPALGSWERLPCLRFVLQHVPVLTRPKGTNAFHGCLGVGWCKSNGGLMVKNYCENRNFFCTNLTRSHSSELVLWASEWWNRLILPLSPPPPPKSLVGVVSAEYMVP